MNRSNFKRHLKHRACWALRIEAILGLTVAATLLSGQPVHAAQTKETNIPGVRVVLPPPLEFDAEHASDAELADYALPPRPNAATDPAGYARWVKAMNASRNRLTNVSLVPTHHYHGPLKKSNSIVSNDNQLAPNWSGLVNINPSPSFTSNSISAVSNQYVVAPVTSSTCSSPGGADITAQWVGIDGGLPRTSDDVLQAGTASQTADSPCGQASYYAWIEWYPYGENQVSGFPVSPGELINLWVWAVNATTGYAVLQNVATNAWVEFEMTAPPGIALQGNTAEWIIERPEICSSTCSFSALADFKTTEFFYNEAFLLSGTADYAGPNSIAYTMTNDSGQNISAATLVPGTDNIKFSYLPDPGPQTSMAIVAQTPTKNGTLEVPLNGSAAFALATDVSTTAPVTATVSVDTGGDSLPLTFSLCQTQPSTGACDAAPTKTLKLTLTNGAEPTFSVFASSTAPIANNPSSNRINVRFIVGGDEVGTASVAVWTP